jgi:hypothetical protein
MSSHPRRIRVERALARLERAVALWQGSMYQMERVRAAVVEIQKRKGYSEAHVVGALNELEAQISLAFVGLDYLADRLMRE